MNCYDYRDIGTDPSYCDGLSRDPDDNEDLDLTGAEAPEGDTAMAKQSQLDRAIQSLEADRAVLDLAILKMKAQRDANKPKAKPRAVADRAVSA